MKRFLKRWQSELSCENALIFCILAGISADILLTVVNFCDRYKVFQPKRALSGTTLRLPVGLLHIYSLVVRDGL